MIVFSNVSLRRGSRELLSDVSLNIHPGQKVGLTGANGTGKSSLFAMVLGELGQDEGDLSIPPQWVIAHVAQQTPSSDASALQYVLDGDKEFVNLHKQLETAEGIFLAELHEQLEIIDGYTTESRAASLLHGLGFSAQQIHQPVNSFSGGWRMRLNLAQALMCRSDLLLLDEPTNHLDLDAVIWLQSWLIQYPGTLLLISHDREFLDAVIDHVAHIEHSSLNLYSGNYSAFERIRAERLAQQQSVHEKQQREIKHMQSFVDRFRAQATKARQAQSRLKALQRMEQIAPAHIDSPFHFSFSQPDKLPDRLLNIEDASVGYNKNAIISHLSLQLMPGQRIGLIGPNGAGKSTLIKLLAGELQLQGGESWQAQDLKIGYFAQHQLEQLKVDESALSHLRELDNRNDKKAREQDLRNYLGGFGFQGERVDEPVKPFSGGEKARLVLALLVYQKPNLLLLDEPTNHLDLEMRLALSVALQEFTGAMVIVSHDRYLLKTVTDEFILVHDGKADPFEGDLDDYAQVIQNKQAIAKSKETPSVLRHSDRSEDKNQDSLANSSKGSTPDVPVLSRKELRQQEAELRKQLQPLRNLVKKAEEVLDKLNKRKVEVESTLLDPNLYKEINKVQLKTLLLEQSEIKQQLEQVEMDWLEASDKYESASVVIKR